MNADQTRLAGIGLSFVVILVSGFWLSRSGRPLNTIILTVHKLIALGAAVYLVINIFQRGRVTPLNGVTLAAVVATAVFFLLTGITGGLLSTDKTMPMVIQKTHQIAPYLTVLSAAGSLYLFSR